MAARRARAGAAGKSREGGGQIGSYGAGAGRSCGSELRLREPRPWRCGGCARLTRRWGRRRPRRELHRLLSTPETNVALTVDCD